VQSAAGQLSHLTPGQVRFADASGKSFLACIDGDEAWLEVFDVAKEGLLWTRAPAPQEAEHTCAALALPKVTNDQNR
jgi:hypothetical protein